MTVENGVRNVSQFIGPAYCLPVSFNFLRESQPNGKRLIQADGRLCTLQVPGLLGVFLFRVFVSSSIPRANAQGLFLVDVLLSVEVWFYYTPPSGPPVF